MKRYLILLSVLILILTSCSKTANDTAQIVDSTTSSAELTAANEVVKYYSADGIELRIDMSQYSENAKLLTADDIYLLSSHCGYISGKQPGLLIIENQEQLDYALERYELISYSMITGYPISDYSYVIEYVEEGQGGYDLKVGALLVDEDDLFFVHTADSYSPEADPMIMLPDVMDGFCFIAAVPKDTLMNSHYEGWTYPDRNDMYQDIDYCYRVRYNLADTTELYQVYGDTGYIVRSNEELQALVDMAQYITDKSNEPAFSFSMNIDFDKTALLFRFFTCDGNAYQNFVDRVTIENDTIEMQYDITEGNYTGFAYAVVPIRFLTSDSYNHWQTPVYDAEHVYAPQIPKIDMSKYSKNAKCFTSDEITLYSKSIDDLGFDGKYSLFCMEDYRQAYIALDNYGFGDDNGFVKLVEQNLGEENIFFVQYIPQTEENSDFRLLGIVVDGNQAEFVYYDRNSERKYNTANGTGGVGFYAAVPIEEIGTDSYEGWEVPTDGQEGDKIEEGYIAVFRSAYNVDVETYETFVYKTETGYKYVNTTSTRLEYTSRKKHTITGSGEVSTKEEILEQAKKNSADTFVTLPDSDILYFIDKFMSMEW